MTGMLAGKVALVTGAGRGIGRAIAQRLARDGARVIVNYSRAKDQADALVGELGGGAFAIRADVADLDAIKAMAEEVAARVDGLDILVNNAGRGTGSIRATTLAEMTPDDYDTIFALNTRGLFFTTQSLLPLIRDAGRIVNFSSTAVMARVSGLSAYAGSKAAVDAFTRVWATELAPRRIVVNAVLPGMIDTDLITEGMGEAAKASAARHHPWGRIGQPEDIADVVAFLAGPDCGWINGQTFVVNGGI